MLPGHSHVAAEREIVTNKNPVTERQAGGERFVVAVADADDRVAAVRVIALAVQVQQAEVAVAVPIEGVLFLGDRGPAGDQRTAHGFDQSVVGDRRPGGGRLGGDDLSQGGGLDNLSASVQAE